MDSEGFSNEEFELEEEQKQPRQILEAANVKVCHGDDDVVLPGEEISRASKPSDSVATCCATANWTPMWIIGTVYMFVFVAYMGFAHFGNATATFVIHTIEALAFIVACAWNLWHTPSHGDLYRAIHRWMGWIAMISGTVIVVTGYILVLKGETSLSETAQIMFMSTGAFQLVVQAVLIYTIRYGNKHSWLSATYAHMVSANVLFYCCAFLPAANRMPQIFGFEDTDLWTFIAMSIGFLLTFLSIGYYSHKLKVKERKERKSDVLNAIH